MLIDVYFLTIFHFLYASLTSALAAASGALFAKKGWEIFATSSFGKNSQTPSLAITKYKSSGVISYSSNSGSGITPTLYAT